jgi:hypothetical protein
VKRPSVGTEEMVTGLEALWREVLPSLEVPFRSRLRSWLRIGTLSAVQYSIHRTARKCWKAGREGRPMNSGMARAYCEHVLEHEMEMQQAGAGWAGWSLSQESRAE